MNSHFFEKYVAITSRRLQCLFDRSEQFPGGCPKKSENPKSKNQDSEFKIQNLKLLLLFLPLLHFSCAVPQWKREHLNDPIMRFDADPDAVEMDNKVLPFREGASGAEGGGRGGCGC